MDGGLRERRRRATELAIETAAVEIARAEGVRAVTVDRVCAAADVSRSTFFNYYSSLDQAIFGRPLEFDSEGARGVLETYGHDLPLAASALVIEEVRGGHTGSELLQHRLELFIREPEITGHVSWGSTTSRARLVHLLTAWLDEHPELARLGPDAHEQEARLAVGASIILGEEVLRRWRGSGEDFALNIGGFAQARAQLAAILS